MVLRSSIGLYPSIEERVPVELEEPVLAADVIPNPPRTRFLREAEAAERQTVDGLEMLVEQGALSVEYWTGAQPDTTVMREALAAVI